MAARHLSGVLALIVLATSACSKTQDTAPQRRFFGSPPLIKSVTLESTGGSQTMFTCDMTMLAPAVLCAFIGADVILDPNFPFVEIDIKYTSSILKAVVTDADSPPGDTDIILVSASIVVPPNEISLVLFDDGSSNRFPFLQTGVSYSLNCTVGTCECGGGPLIHNLLRSGDQTGNDGLFTRFAAFYSSSLHEKENALLQFCIARDRGESSKLLLDVGTALEFRIDAVDKSGNLTTSTQKPKLTVAPTSYTCKGDQCACCVLTCGGSDNPCNCIDGRPGLKFRSDPSGPGFCGG